MKRKTTAIISLALAVSIAAGIAGCSANSKKPDGEYVSSITSQAENVTDENGNTVSEGQESTATTANETTKKKISIFKKKQESTTAKPYYVTNINGKKITTTVAYEKVTNKKGEVVTDKKGKPVTTEITSATSTTKKGETTTKAVQGTTTFTTRNNTGNSSLPEDSLDGNALTESLAFELLQSKYPEKWINLFPNYDPNNNGDYAYFAVFTNPDKHTITSVITVDLVTGRANEKNLATGKITSINIL
ncbi:hypothetical protein [Eubacterium sp.]|uniref:hypothetical protein n=1 Tax=Eubacterium sp. TaxID=142586 RepID=UPI003F06BCEB